MFTKIFTFSILMLLFSSPLQGASLECTDFSDDPNCSALSELVNLIGESSEVHKNYNDRINNIYNSQSVLSQKNLHCSQIQKEGDCDDLFQQGPLASLITSTAHVTMSNIILTRPKGLGAADLPQSRSLTSEEAEKCLCIESSFTLRMANDYEKFTDFVDQKVDELSKSVLKSYGKKLVNDYSHIYEDGIYLLNHSDVINHKKSADVLCRGAHQFEKAVQESCPKRSKSFIQDRIGLIFSEVDFNGATTLEEKLNYIDYNTIHRKTKDKDGNEVTYLRLEYDKTRYGLKQTHEFQVLDKMLTNLFTKKGLDKSRHKTPFRPGLEVISNHLSDLFINDFEGAIATLFDGKLPPKLLKEWRQVLEGPNARNEFEGRFTRYLLKVAPSHPGLSAILLDNSTFKSFLDHMNSNKKTKSVFDELENNFKKIHSYMDRRCSQMIEDFASVVCMDDKEVINGMSKESIASFVQDSDDDFDQIGGTKDLLACRGGFNSMPAFSGLNREGSKIVNSDYHTYSKQKDEASDAYSLFAHNIVNDEEKRKLMGYAASVSGDVTRKSRGYDPIIEQFGNFKKAKLVDATGVVRENQLAETSSESVMSESSSLIKGSAPNVHSYGLNSAGNDFRLPKGSDTRDIVELLSHREDKVEIESHVSKLDSKEIAALREFRKHALEEKEDILKLQLDQEKNNLEKLKSKIDELMISKTDIDNRVQNSDALKEESQEKLASSQIKTFVPELKEQSFYYNKPQEIRAVSSAQISSTGAGPVASLASRSVASVITGKESLSKDSNVFKGGIVVQEKAEIVRNAQEINENIVEYLKSVDSETFLRFTKEGVVYKYKTLENGIVVEKEIYVSMNDVDPEVLSEIAKESESKINKMRRQFSYESLKIIISEEVLKLTSGS